MGYAAEEVGLLGSGEIAQLFASSKTPIRAMLCLDMNGYSPVGSNAQPRVFFDPYFMDPALTMFLEATVNTYSQIGRAETRGYGYAASDHASFARAGFPSAHVKESTSYPYIHTDRDTVDKINFDFLMQFV